MADSLVTSPNRAETQRLWRLIDAGYQPIDWHVDFKSGWRWASTSWHRDIAGGPLGADLKVPWELARLQHLPQLAVASEYAQKTKGFPPAEVLRAEYRNQLLDFTPRTHQGSA